MKRREIGPELMRVVATVMVITLHILGRGGIIYNADRTGLLYWVAWFLEIAAYGAVNCFALISGYVMFRRPVKVSNLVSLWLQACFYSVLITGLFYLFRPGMVGLKDLVLSAFPVFTWQYWYVSAYFALFFLMPFLNLIVDRAPKQTLHKLFLALGLGVGIIDCILPGEPFFIADGYSTVWLAVMYLVGAYIKKYTIAERISPKKCMAVAVGLFLLTLLSKFAISFLTELILGKAKGDNMFMRYSSLPVAVSAVCLFLCCLRAKVGKIGTKIVNLLAPTALGVYLIHVHPCIYNGILAESFAFLIDWPVVLMVLAVAAAMIGIFLVCAVVEWARMGLFRVLRVKAFAQFVDRKTNALLRKIFETEKIPAEEK